MVEAKEEVQVAFKEPDKCHQINLQFVKDNLQEVYNHITEENLEEMVQKVENANSIYKHAESWKLINGKWSKNRVEVWRKD